jgi:hypothetical protein
MTVGLFWLILVVAVVAMIVWRLSTLAGRLDRLHHRIELADASLDAQLARRARATEALGTSGLLDPSSSIVLALAASNSRNASSASPVDRGIAESELSRDLREVLGDQEAVDYLRSTPEGEEILTDLAYAANQVALSRRFRNDGVQATRLLRSGVIVRVFHLAGSAPMPQMMEMDDVPPATLAPLI